MEPKAGEKATSTYGGVSEWLHPWPSRGLAAHDKTHRDGVTMEPKAGEKATSTYGGAKGFLGRRDRDEAQKLRD
jgi:hypothetical protein